MHLPDAPPEDRSPGRLEQERQLLERLFTALHSRLVRYAEAQIGQRFQGHILGDSVVGSVLKSLCVGLENDKFPFPLEAEPDDLYPRLLRRIKTKIRERIRDLGRDKRNIHREVRLDHSPAAGADDPGPGLDLADAHTWDPLHDLSEEECAEVVSQIAQQLTDQQREVLWRRVEGRTYAHIAAELGCTVYEVKVIVRRIQTIYQGRIP